GAADGAGGARRVRPARRGRGPRRHRDGRRAGFPDGADLPGAAVVHDRGSQDDHARPAADVRREVLRADGRSGDQHRRADRVHDRGPGHQAPLPDRRARVRTEVTKRILVVEDDPDIALSLRHKLERDGGFAVDVVADGTRGLEAAKGAPPDLVLLDLNLPGMDGFAVCRDLRKHAATASVPIIMLTARIGEDDRVAGLDLGADDYITKPFSPKEALARV